MHVSSLGWRTGWLRKAPNALAYNWAAQSGGDDEAIVSLRARTRPIRYHAILGPADDGAGGRGDGVEKAPVRPAITDIGLVTYPRDGGDRRMSSAIGRTLT